VCRCSVLTSTGCVDLDFAKQRSCVYLSNCGKLPDNRPCQFLCVQLPSPPPLRLHSYTQGSKVNILTTSSHGSSPITDLRQLGCCCPRRASTTKWEKNIPYSPTRLQHTDLDRRPFCCHTAAVAPHSTTHDFSHPPTPHPLTPPPQSPPRHQH